MAARAFRPASIALLLTALLPAALTAQGFPDENTDPFGRRNGPPHFDITFGAGAFASSDWSDLVLLSAGPAGTGAFNQIVLRDFAVLPGPAIDAAATYWRGRLGVRFHAAFSPSCISTGTSCDDDRPENGEEPRVFRQRAADIDTWIFDVNGVIGLREYDESRTFFPYALVGFGVVSFNPDDGEGLPPDFLVGGIPTDPVNGERIIIILDDATTALVVDELGFETVIAVTLGIGTHLRIPIGSGSVGLRLELADHISPSPLNARIIRIGDDDDFFDINDPNAVVADLNRRAVHNVRFVAGIVLDIGLDD